MPGQFFRTSAWRLPRQDEGTPNSRRIKYLSLHFNPYISSVGPPPIYEVANFIIRWEMPYDQQDSALGIIDEITGFWIPKHSIRQSDFGLSHPDFARNGKADFGPTETEREAWDLWQ